MSTTTVHIARSPAPPYPAEAARSFQKELAPFGHEAQHIGALADRIALNDVKNGNAWVTYGKDTASFIDGVGKAGEYTKKAQDAARAAQAVPKHMYAVAQMGSGLQKLRREMLIAEVGAKHFKSDACASALVFMRREFLVAEDAFRRERSMWYGYSSVVKDHASSLHHKSETTLGKMALGAEKYLAKSSLGRQLLDKGKIVSNPSVGKALIGVGVASAAIRGYDDSVLTSTLGKVGSAVTGGAIALGTDLATVELVATRGVHPAVALFDPIVTYGAAALGQKEEGEKYTFGKWADGTANVLSAIGGWAWGGESRALDDVHARNMAGKNGVVLQGYAQMGDAISKLGIVDSAMTSIADWQYELAHKAPADIKKSTLWWWSH